MSGLSLQARRWRTIIVTVPVIGATSCECRQFSEDLITWKDSKGFAFVDVLYQRLVMGKPQRKLPQRDDTEGVKKRVIELKPEDTTSNTGS